MSYFFYMGWSEPSISLAGCSDDDPRPFDCKIYAYNSESDEEIKVGEASGCVIPSQIGDNATDLLETADINSSETWELVNAVIDSETNDYREELELESYGDILCVHTIKILPEFRNRNLGLTVLWHILDRFGHGCAVALIKPHPIGTAHEPESNPYRLDDLRQMSPERMHKKQQVLGRYWRKAGFDPIPGNSDYYYHDMAYCIGKCPKIEEERANHV